MKKTQQTLDLPADSSSTVMVKREESDKSDRQLVPAEIDNRIDSDKEGANGSDILKQIIDSWRSLE